MTAKLSPDSIGLIFTMNAAGHPADEIADAAGCSYPNLRAARLDVCRLEAREHVVRNANDEFQSELASLREELAKLKDAARVAGEVGAPNFHAMKQRLAATEQRNAALESLIHRALFSEVNDGYVDRFAARDELKVLLKPTESGATEKCLSDGGTCGLGGQCHMCPHKESGASE
jgi:hypothetical protein